MPILTRHSIGGGARWAFDGRLLAPGFSLAELMALPAQDAAAVLKNSSGDAPPEGTLLAPVEAASEVWAAGVTYLRSRIARGDTVRITIGELTLENEVRT